MSIRSSNRGFTLVEMVVVLGIFSAVMVMVGSSFTTLIKYSSKYMKSQESNIEGNVGLEVLRHDISAAGFGLPTAFFSSDPTYSEVAASHEQAFSLDDAPHGIPKALAGTYNVSSALSDTGSDGNTSYTLLPATSGNVASDYLTIKATSLGTEATAQKWTYAGYSSLPKAPKSWSSGNLANGEQVIVLDRSASDPNGNYQLLKDPVTGSFWTSYSNSGLPSGFNALTPLDTAFIYGIAPKGVTPRMPFNRVDYLVATPPANSGLLPNYCAPNTGILYRGVVQHGSSSGALDYQPLVDCVAAMHVVLGWNMLDAGGNVVTDSTKTGSGAIDTWTNVDGTNSSGSNAPMAAPNGAVTDAGQIRTKLKVVKVYLLVQDGRRDTSHTSPSTIKMFSSEEGNTPLGQGANYTLQPNMLNYRWKVYQLVIRPKNLASNQ